MIVMMTDLLFLANVITFKYLIHMVTPTIIATRKSLAMVLHIVKQNNLLISIEMIRDLHRPVSRAIKIPPTLPLPLPTPTATT